MTGLRAETSLGVLIWTDDHGEAALLDPGSGRVVLWSERDDGPLTLTNRRTGVSHPVPRPTPRGQAGLGQVSPDGRLLAIEFGDTSWSRVQGQVFDIWLLDLQARSWRCDVAPRPGAAGHQAAGAPRLRRVGLGRPLARLY